MFGPERVAVSLVGTQARLRLMAMMPLFESIAKTRLPPKATAPLLLGLGLSVGKNSVSRFHIPAPAKFERSNRRKLSGASMETPAINLLGTSTPIGATFGKPARLSITLASPEDGSHCTWRHVAPPPLPQKVFPAPKAKPREKSPGLAPAGLRTV